MTAISAEGRLRGPAGENGIDVRWIMPEGFFEIPLDAEDLDETADQLMELARGVMPEADFDVQLQWAVMCAAHYDSFVEAGVQYAGFVLTEVEGTRCTATVTVSMIDLDARAGSNPVGFMGTSMRHLGIGQVSEIELPCGPAVCCIGDRRGSLDGSLTESGQDETVRTSFIQVQVPLANGTAVVMEMGTPTPEGWDVFSSMFAGVVKSVRLFDAEGEPVVMPG
ncbi:MULTISPECIES: hypothetical protein [Streptomyces]|uniref:Uncharacterized protein n=1 Tax=Streptomyces triticiradicis TaxID=2651189 RepID=A0A7J5DDK9_9ACTN|nr:hypothetical protein [Streptomyces triticiradicis]KAB1986932.1 hypothetical protein F8144_19905 [Streptomyces triticiradicis]